MAALFSAVGATGPIPLGFLDGVISSFPKAGAVDPMSAASYRPITLTDTDYRTLARVLARRLSVVFGVVIDPEQTTVLQRRRIADIILLLQLLPELLRWRGRAGVALFLDFYKAYDTLDRDFLLDCLAALGVGDGFLAWVLRLLTGTRSAALPRERLPVRLGAD